MSQLSVLSGIIAGEGRGQGDQYGVASVIYNRAQGIPDASGTPFSSAFGGGSGNAYTVATAPGQFSAYPSMMGTPTPYTNQLAANLLAGQPPGSGSTGNALYYNAPNFNAAYASGSGNNYGAGTNQYSDGYNQPPSSNFQLPNSSGAGSTIANGPDATSTNPYLTMEPSDPNFGDITGLSVAGVNAPLPSTTTGSGTSGVTPGASAATTSGNNAPNTNVPAQGTPIQTALQPEETSFITSTVQGIEKAFGAGTQAVITAASNAVGTYFAGLQNWFSRAFLIILGIVILAIGLIALLWDHGGQKFAGQVMTMARA